MALTIALQNYLSGLGLSVPEELSLEFVQQLQAKHVERYSFNSLAVVLGEEISLDLESISEKIVTRGLGGYCFEHNKLTFELLNALGYDVQLKLARVLNNNLDREAGRTHRVTLLTIDSATYLVDSGFGSDGPIAPLRVDIDSPQKAGFDHYRLFAHENGEYDLQLVKGGEYFTLYRFDLADYTNGDCGVGHFYSHKHPNAVFLNNLMMTLKKSDQTFSLLNSEFIIRNEKGEHKQILDTPALLASTLSSVFNLHLEPAVIEHLFARFLAPALSTSDAGTA